MTDTSVIISMIDPEGKTRKKSIAKINTAVTQDELVTWSKKLVGTTENSYVSTTRVDSVKLD